LYFILFLQAERFSSAGAAFCAPLKELVERSRYAAGKIKDSVYYPYLPNSGHL